MQPDSLTHITLTTGHSRQSAHAEIDPQIEAIIAPWLRELLASDEERKPLPGLLPGLLPEFLAYDVMAEEVGGGMLLTVLAGMDPLVTVGVTATDEDDGNLWPMFRTAFPWVRPGLARPPAPWCAVITHPALADHQDAANWLADFERCVAWAWITMRDEDGD